MSKKVSSLRELKSLTGYKQHEIARLLGCSQPNVSRWYRGSVQPEGIHAMTIALSLMIARINVELLHVVPEMPPRDAVGTIARVLGTDVGLHYWLGLSSPYSVIDLKDTPPMKRIAALLNVVDVFMPDIASKIRENYPKGVIRAQDARADLVKIADDRRDRKRAEWMKNRKRLREHGDNKS